MKKLYKVTLTAEERIQLETIVSTGKNNAQKIKHANILLAVDETVNGKTTGNGGTNSPDGLKCQIQIQRTFSSFSENFRSCL